VEKPCNRARKVFAPHCVHHLRTRSVRRNCLTCTFDFRLVSPFLSFIFRHLAPFEYCERKLNGRTIKCAVLDMTRVSRTKDTRATKQTNTQSPAGLERQRHPNSDNERSETDNLNKNRRAEMKQLNDRARKARNQRRYYQK
jgi:hypothetical protein